MSHHVHSSPYNPLSQRICCVALHYNSLLHHVCESLSKTLTPTIHNMTRHYMMHYMMHVLYACTSSYHRQNPSLYISTLLYSPLHHPLILCPALACITCHCKISLSPSTICRAAFYKNYFSTMSVSNMSPSNTSALTNTMSYHHKSLLALRVMPLYRNSFSTVSNIAFLDYIWCAT